jgi:tRNA(Glu) U13 pseudouridine synthase TruD
LKENIGTTELISQLAHSLRTKDRYFTFAGTKDRDQEIKCIF